MTRYVALVLAALCIAPALADDNTGSVEGTLLDEVTGKPAARVPIVLDGNHGLLQSQTDGNGHFVFLTVLPGHYGIQTTRGATIGGRCGPEPVIDVDAGLTWHLPNLRYGRRQMIFAVCSIGEPTQLLHQIQSAGTTASLYIINE
jgi:hypothetical protein